MSDQIIQKPEMKKTYKYTCLMSDFYFATFSYKVCFYIITEPAGFECLDFYH